jgi:MYB-related transcription factor LHY
MTSTPSDQASSCWTIPFYFCFFFLDLEMEVNSSGEETVVKVSCSVMCLLFSDNE